MKYRVLTLAAALLFSVTVSTPVLSKDYRYITDSLEVTMRAGNTTQHRITKMLRSGTKVEILEIDKGWAHVVTPQGRKGWMLARFLINTPVARERLSKAEAQLKALTVGDDVLRSQLIKLQNENKGLKQQNTALNIRSTQLAHDLKELRANTANTVAILRSNTLLKNQSDRLKSELGDVRKENENYKNNSAQDWFVRGAAVIFGGILLGLLLPRLPLPRRKKDMWSSL